MSFYGLPVRRPIGTVMFFGALLLLGALAWQRIPVELFPQISGSELSVSFYRPGSEPEVVEREILMRLEARSGELAGVAETWGEVRGAGGTFRVRFEPGVDIQVRELDLQRLAAELQRSQPRGSRIVVEQDTFTRILNAGIAMQLQITGGADRDSLLDLVQQRIVPRLSALPGVSQAQAFGGSPRELRVDVDPELCAAQGIAPEQVIGALTRAVGRLRFVGGAEDEAGRTSVVLDGRPSGPVSLGELRLAPDRPVLLRHVAHLALGVGREETEFRVNGKPAVGLIVFQESGSNLVRLGRELRARVAELRSEFGPYGVDFIVGFDAAELVEEQLDRLRDLAVSGFAIALVVLYLFLRQWRAVGVVGIAAPASLLTAMALLYLSGWSLNVVTLFGLAIGIDLVIDNAIVVYEATQRLLERGASPDHAAEEAVRRTGRAIVAGTLTNAVVFLPLAFVQLDDATTRSLLTAMAVAITLPMAGSVLVAIGLVPLLARRLAAPAAVARLAKLRARRE
ncbi:MAG TPA: efflux RND transporter permease subunit, partial [Candidatus Polarisedimenticolaceae bacterium]|nr:efflux RND transporter permease subunit [Candidatus Polarisedimenticolaceae bacterium]